MKADQKFQSVRSLVNSLTAEVMGKHVLFRVERDVKRPKTGRVFIQCTYQSRCTVTKETRTWHGRKWYLSDHMTEDEIVKTCFAAFRATVDHEVMEGFKFDGRRIFNPHASWRALMAASSQQIYRTTENSI
jgi:hypothetical protein